MQLRSFFISGIRFIDLKIFFSNRTFFQLGNIPGVRAGNA